MDEIITVVQQLEKQWLSYYLSGDVDGFASLLDEQFVYSSERGVFRKAQYVDNLAQGMIEMHSLNNTEITTYVHLDGQIAVSIGIVAMDARFQGNDISGNDRFTRVWKRVGATYQAIALHANGMLEENQRPQS